MRQEGYYWVKIDGSGWKVAFFRKYNDRHYWSFGGHGLYEDIDMDQINENRIPEPE